MWHCIVAFMDYPFRAKIFFCFVPKNIFLHLKKKKSTNFHQFQTTTLLPKNKSIYKSHKKKKTKYTLSNYTIKPKSPPEFHSTSCLASNIRITHLAQNLRIYDAFNDGFCAHKGHKHRRERNAPPTTTTTTTSGFVKLRIYKVHGTHLES